MGEPTQIKSDEQNLPVPASPVQPEAYQRAPTLMAGAEPGEQGAVQVWAPDIDGLHRQAWVAGSLTAWFLVLNVVLLGLTHGQSFGVGGMAVLPMLALMGLAAAIRRPCYLTTDEDGIGVTTTNSSRALRWNEIRSLNTTNTGLVRLQLLLNTGQPLDLNLLGYPDEVRKALVELILNRANLQPHSKTKFLHTRAAAPLAAGDGETWDRATGRHGKKCEM